MGSTVFVRDLHKFITGYGTTDRIPEQQLIVFDEAQRAWDSHYMLEKKGIAHSEPELCALFVGERLPGLGDASRPRRYRTDSFTREKKAAWRCGAKHSVASMQVLGKSSCPPSIVDYFADLMPEVNRAL